MILTGGHEVHGDAVFHRAELTTKCAWRNGGRRVGKAEGKDVLGCGKTGLAFFINYKIQKYLCKWTIKINQNLVNKLISPYIFR